MNKTAKTAMITALTLCVVGMVLSTAGYFAGGKDFNDSSGHKKLYFIFMAPPPIL